MNSLSRLLASPLHSRFASPLIAIHSQLLQSRHLMNAHLPTTVPTTLNGFAPGAHVRVLDVAGPLAVRRRLLEMGLCPGVTLEVLRRAPLGDPLEVRVRGYLLSLRLDQATQVTVAAIASVTSVAV